MIFSMNIIACRQETPEEALLTQFGKLSLKKETLQSYMERTVERLFPGDKTKLHYTRRLMEKCRPLLEECNQHKQLSVQRFFDIMVYAQQKRGDPGYYKKGSVKRSLIVTGTEFYILLKSSGGCAAASDTTRLTRAIRVPFDLHAKPSIVYQLVNRDAYRPLSRAELHARDFYSQTKKAAVKHLATFSYVKRKDDLEIAKATAFVESTSGALAGYNPSQDKARTFSCSPYELLGYVKAGDLDSIHFLLANLHKKSGDDYSDAFRLAYSAKRYDIMTLLLEEGDVKEDTLLNCFPESVETEEEKALTTLMVNSCEDRKGAIASLCTIAIAKNADPVKFVSRLGPIAQDLLLELLRTSENLELVRSLTDHIPHVGLKGGHALECACFNKQWAKAFILIEKGVDINFSVDGDGETPLYYAACHPEDEHSLDALKKLLALGADPTILRDAYPVIYWAEKEGNKQTVAILRSKMLEK